MGVKESKVVYSLPCFALLNFYFFYFRYLNDQINVWFLTSDPLFTLYQHGFKVIKQFPSINKYRDKDKLQYKSGSSIINMCRSCVFKKNYKKTG